MPRPLSAALTVVATVAIVLASPISPISPASAQTPGDEPPAGASDGIPVGGDESEAEPQGEVDDPAAGREGSSDEESASREATTRYFSRDVYESIRGAVTATTRPCPVSDNGLTALVLAPIFRESSGATSPSTVPSPMTLSRYDEWDGSSGTTSNKATNRTLYEGRDPQTPYSRAYWHPGIGIWQYDSAGVGAPYTAVERMDARIIAPGITAPMITRYCNAKNSGSSDAAARAAAWQPWVGCASNGCETVFQDLMSSNFSNLVLTDSVSQLGGTQLRTCTVGSGSFPCAYVDPDQAEGARWWVTLDPDDGDPTKTPAPLSHPFYVFEADGKEHRHWFREDTGYPVDISATRTLGKNARARTDQPGSGLTWSRASELCDLTTFTGNCEALPPSPRKLMHTSVGGDYVPVEGDFDGNGRDDILWYGPGSASDYLWRWNGSGFSSLPVSVGGAYRPLVGDFDDDGRDDIFWYGPGSASDYLWQWNGSGFSSTQQTVRGVYEPLVGDLDGTGGDDIFWYAAGDVADYLWRWSGGGFDSLASPVGGHYVPVVGDIDGNGSDDVLWYGPGSASDYLWRWSGSTFASMQVSVGGSYRPVVGDYDADGRDDVLWYGPGLASDYLWRWNGSGFSSLQVSVGGDYVPVVGSIVPGGGAEIVWYAPGPASDYLWQWNGSGFSSGSVRLDEYYEPLVGQFDGAGILDVFWYAPGPTSDPFWYG